MWPMNLTVPTHTVGAILWCAGHRWRSQSSAGWYRETSTAFHFVSNILHSISRWVSVYVCWTGCYKPLLVSVNQIYVVFLCRSSKTCCPQQALLQLQRCTNLTDLFCTSLQLKKALLGPKRFANWSYLPRVFCSRTNKLPTLWLVRSSSPCPCVVFHKHTYVCMYVCTFK